MLTFAIGDLHGRYDLLLAAWAEIQKYAHDYYNNKKALMSERPKRFIILGDFIDRGPQSREIIEFLMKGPHNGKGEFLPDWEWIILQGNHEAMMLDSLVDHNMRVANVWLKYNGGSQTLVSYGYQDEDTILPCKVPKNHLHWLQSLSIFFQDEKHIYVHAGVPYDSPVEETSQEVLQWMLYSDEETDSYNPETAIIEADRTHSSGKHIVHGHHQKMNGPILHMHRTNLDTYAWRTGHLGIGVFLPTIAQPKEILSIKHPGIL